MIFTTILNLYILRIVIKTIGLDQYGLYESIAAVAGVFTIANTLLSNALQKYYAEAIGNRDSDKLKKIYVSGVIISIVSAILMVIAGESIGLWIINEKINIQNNERLVINIVYQVLLIVTISSIIQIPYISLILANENTKIYSGITIVESILKLILVLILDNAGKKEIVNYAIMMMILNLVVTYLYRAATIKLFKFKVQRSEIDKKLIKEVLNFGGWTMVGAAASFGNNQIITLMINIFFDPITSAARAISMQVANSINIFVSGLITAVKPRLIKLYSQNSIEELQLLYSISNKFILYALILIFSPIICDMDYLLGIWLNLNNHITTQFSKLMVVYAIVMALNNPISIIVQASGRVKKYNLIVEPLILLALPVVYIIFKMGLEAEYCYWIMIIFAICAQVARIIYLERIIKFKLKNYIIEIILPAIIMVMLISLLMKYNTYTGVLSLMLNYIITFLVVGIIAVLSNMRHIKVFLTK